VLTWVYENGRAVDLGVNATAALLLEALRNITKDEMQSRD